MGKYAAIVQMNRENAEFSGCEEIDDVLQENDRWV
jgi:hypothetical protein